MAQHPAPGSAGAVLRPADRHRQQLDGRAPRGVSGRAPHVQVEQEEGDAQLARPGPGARAPGRGAAPGRDLALPAARQGDGPVRQGQDHQGPEAGGGGAHQGVAQGLHGPADAHGGADRRASVGACGRTLGRTPGGATTALPTATGARAPVGTAKGAWDRLTAERRDGRGVRRAGLRPARRPRTTAGQGDERLVRPLGLAALRV